jgi:protein tyrosine phosphatase (PTP) superfamily phosphohydrolase (DUF442 family)
VVPFLCNRSVFNTFGFFLSRVTLILLGLSMKRHWTLFSLSFLFFLALSSFAHARPQTAAASATVTQSTFGQKLHIPGLPNAGKINDHLYRGAQPREQGLDELKKLGITTVVDLRGEDPQKIAWERKETEALGMHFVNIPVSGWSPPTNEQVAQFLSLFRDAPGQKVFVHCHFGDDRTGVFIATYRMALEKLPPEQALREMYYFGFNGFWHPSMKTFIREFPARLATAPALAPSRDPKTPVEQAPPN